MRIEIHPECIRFTSDCLGFDGFRALVCEVPDDGEAGSGRRGYPYFRFACRPVQEKGRTLLTFEENRESASMSRISSIIPPNRPFHLAWRGAAGRIGCFDVHPRFFEEALRRTGIAAADLHRVPPPRFVIDRRVDWLCQLLMQETEQGCPSGRAYFEGLVNAVIIAVASQIDSRLPLAGNPDAQHHAIRRAIALMEANYASKLTRDEVARAACLSPFHFSRLFHRIVGLAPHQYLLRCRLRNAQKLLSTEEGRSVADVAAETGFADQAHFSRHFRRAFGKSPQQFRRAHE
jgi:AraC-like DNA-binding protein